MVSRSIRTLFALVFLVVLVRTAWISDDALITFRSILNLTHGFGPTFNIDERVQAFTHPLWAAVLTVGYLILGNLYVAAFALSAAFSTAAFVVALRWSATFSQAIAVGVALLSSRAFIDYATSGLENPLAFVLVAALFGALFLDTRSDASRRLMHVTLIASALYLTRPDLILLVAPALTMACLDVGAIARLPRPLLIGGLPALAWTIFSLVYYGFPFPNTAYAKLMTGIPASERWWQGLLYFVDSIDRDPTTMLAIGWSVIVAIASGDRVARTIVSGLVVYLLYVVSVGGDFMAGRFLSVPLYAAALLLGLQKGSDRAPWIVAASIFAVTGVVARTGTLASDSRFTDTAIGVNGVADERGFYFRTAGLVRADRWSFPMPLWPTADRLQTPSSIKQACGQLGEEGLQLGPQVHLLDHCGLADPLLARLPAAFDVHWRTGHYSRTVPEGYEESLLKNGNVLADENLRLLYQDIRLITRSAGLFSSARWRAIVRANTGGTALIDHSVARFGIARDVRDFARVFAEGTPTDAPGIHHMTEPLVLSCRAQPGRRYLDLTLHARARYHIVFVLAGTEVASLDLLAAPHSTGLRNWTLDIPQDAVERGFDLVVIAPVSGTAVDPAVGHVLIDGVAETDAELARRVAARDGAAAGSR